MIRRAEAIKNVVELQSIFKESFAVYGTALGSFRENNIMEHDPDTDIGIFSEHFEWAGVTEAVKRGFRILSVFGMRYHGMEIAFARDGVKTDLMFFYKSKEDPTKRFNCLWDNGGRRGMSDQIMHEYDEKLFKIINGKIGSDFIRTLDIDYIEHVYGKDWKTPVTKWDWRTDHKCRKND